MKYEHFSLEKASVLFEKGKKRKYLVKTINWSFAHERGKADYGKVHRNEYIWTGAYLIRWIRNTEEVAEDIYSIEPIKEVKKR
jgi:hypothetical protein